MDEQGDDPGPISTDQGFTGDGAVQTTNEPIHPSVSPPLLTFEGLSNQDNANLFGFQVSPPDPNGAVSANFYVEMVNLTNQSVEASPGVAGVRWYEIRRVDQTISLYQQGTYAPADAVNRWMGSIAMNKHGDMALGYSVSNATTVFPGIRYTGRLNGDPLGQMTLGEGVLINGTGSQTASARWGDYTDMVVDPSDDCTFWYVNQYYQTTSARGWQTRIGSFRVSNCA